MTTPRGDLQLAIGYWIVSHKQTLRTWWAITFMAVMGLSLLWTVFFFSVFFSQEAKVGELITSAANGAGSFRAATLKPTPLVIGPVNVVVRDDAHVDLVTEVTNPNSAWAATDVVAHYTVDGVDLPTQHWFINQDARRPFLHINATIKKKDAVTAVLTIEDTNWTRASAGGLPAPKFTVANVVTTPSTVNIDGELRTSVTVKAEITNASVYNFFRVNIPVVVRNGDHVVAVGQVDFERWPTLSKRALNLTFGYPVGNVTDVRIEPQVSRFDFGNTYR